MLVTSPKANTIAMLHPTARTKRMLELDKALEPVREAAQKKREGVPEYQNWNPTAKEAAWVKEYKEELLKDVGDTEEEPEGTPL